MTNEKFLEELKVINDSTRLTIIQMLSKKGTMCACKILEELNITQGTLSHHMKVLTSAGLVICEKDGKWCNYTLVKKEICELAYFIEDICDDSSFKNDCTGHNR
ncbi:MAG: metalloregulator ArsR/SmtB family transcription factor [Anaeroplasma bactoclasticum]|nr:metalloregulator ArsR/SmtB family transcription factor [Anaeroplasma bactoclasticum]